MQNRSLLYGEGLFETILYRGKTKRLRRHYERLQKSAEYFKIPCPDFETFFQKIEEKTKGRKELYVKVCLFSYGGAKYYQEPSEGRLKVYTGKLKPPPPFVELSFSMCKRHSEDPIPKHKTLNYLFNVLVKREAQKRGFYDCIILNEKGQITETASANVVILKKGELLTPHRESGLLLGTTLQILMEKAKVREVFITPEELLSSDSVFITNSLVGIVPVKRIERKEFSWDRDLLEKLKNLMKEEDEAIP